MQTARDGLCNLQHIGPDGQQTGAIWGAGQPRGVPIIAIGEGFATMAAMRLATGLLVVAAMMTGNLELVALAIRTELQAVWLILCAEMDAGPHGNIGLAKANAAAAAVPGALMALNAERAAEEAQGQVRWLRPDHQIPRFAKPA